jgi:hypothetical protein
MKLGMGLFHLMLWLRKRRCFAFSARSTTKQMLTIAMLKDLIDYYFDNQGVLNCVSAKGAEM